MKRFITSLRLLCMGLSAMAQEALIPENYMETDPALAYQYEQNILNCSEWLINTPLTPEMQYPRMAVSQFVMMWMQVSPSIQINFDTTLMEFLDDLTSEDLQTNMATVYCASYMAGLIREKAAEGKINTSTVVPKGTTNADKVTGAMSAIEGCIRFYDNNKEQIGRIRTLEKYKKMQKEGTLRDYVEGNLGTR